MFARVFTVPLSFAILLTNLCGNASAQQYGRQGGGRQNAPQATPFSKTGAIESLNGNGLIISAGGQKYMVGLNQQTEVHVTGTAEPEYLSPKMFVEFVADISDKGDGKDKVEKLTICNPTSDRPAGLSPPTAPETKKVKDNDGNKGKDAAAAPGSDMAGASDTPAAGKKGRSKTTDSPFDQGGSFSSKTKRATVEKLPGTFTVRGIVKSYKNHKLIVATGHGPQIKVDLSDTAAIEVDISDLHNVSQGDKVTVKGQGMQNRVYADSISVELSNPLTSVKKKGSHSEKPAKAASNSAAN